MSMSALAKPNLAAALLLVPVLIVTACSSSKGTSGASGTSGGGGGGGTLPIAGLTLLTGPLADFGAGANQGLKAAVTDVNTNGGVLGKSLKLITADSTSDPVDAVPAATKLINVNKVLLENGVAGPIADATVNQFTKAGIPFLTPGGDVNFDHNTNPLVWRLTPSDSQLGVAISVYASDAKYKKIALLFTNNSTSQGLEGIVKSTFTAKGGQITSSQTLQPDLSSYQSEVEKTLSGHPDAIVIEMDPASAAVVFKEMKSLNGLSTPVIGTDTTVGTDFVKAIGVAAATKSLVSVEGGTFNSPATKAFTAAVQKSAHAAPLANASYCYDGIIISALAMVAQNGTSKSDIQKGIPVVTRAGGTKVYSYSEGVTALKAGKTIQYIGASGPFEFNKYHNVFGPFVAVRVGADGKTYSTVKTMSAESLAAATK
jgi:ABC-type branched-subunit amino acid transport system substrate-binding protein